MTKIERMIQELGYENVKFKKVKDVFQRLKGTPITAGKMKEIDNPDGKIRIFAGGKTVINANEEDIPNANIIKVPSVLVQSRGIIDVIYYDKPFTFKNEMWAYTANEQITVKYLYYVLKNNLVHFRDAASGMGSLPQISLPVTEEFVIPIPPLEVQNEIVRILDNFTGLIEELTKELTAELTSRKKQYEYYRNKLLTFAEFDSTLEAEKQRSREAVIRHLQHTFGYAYVTLEDIAINYDIQRKPVTSEKREKGNIPYYGASGIIDYVKDYIFDGDYLLISEDGANLLTRTMPIAFSISGKAWVNNHAHVLKFEEYATRRYVEMYLNSIDLTPYITGAAQPKLNHKNLNKIKIPLPILEEQEKIVTILDHFDTLCNDLTTGLPAEIEARKKQYEYYRDKLLSFQEQN